MSRHMRPWRAVCRGVPPVRPEEQDEGQQGRGRRGFRRIGGTGIHIGKAFVGTVQGTEGTVSDVTTLGDNVNITARLASNAGPGEALTSDVTSTAAGLNLDKLERRQLEPRGKSRPISVHVLRL